MIVTERETPEGLLVSVCDRDIIGETFSDDPISITVSEEFYGGDPADTETVLETLSRAAVANIVGIRSVKLAIDHGFVDEANVLEIDGTLHAQYLKMHR